MMSDRWLSVPHGVASNRKNIGTSTATGGNMRFDRIQNARFSPPACRGKRAKA